MESQVYLLIAMAASMFIVIGGLSLLAHYYTLNGIKSKTVGDGQHGTARFATKKEIIKTYKHLEHVPHQVFVLVPLLQLLNTSRYLNSSNSSWSEKTPVQRFLSTKSSVSVILSRSSS